MSSFVYFYSKFTDEFLLLTAGAMFFLLASYCYHWVIVRRRLGTSPQMVPASVVKEYLNQLINEAQFIRTQLFGILSSANANQDPAHVDALFDSLLAGRGSAASYAGAADTTHGSEAATEGSVPPELLDRIKSLEAQLAEKEGMIVNVNIEKTKLAKDLETFKLSKNTAAAPASDQNNEELLKRLKMLEQQLEEYNMFEDDLANIKRIQQENEQLKRKIEEVSAHNGSAKSPAPTLAVAPPPPAAEPAIAAELAAKAPSLDQASIDALLDGESPIPPAAEAAPPAQEGSMLPGASATPAADIPAAELENLAKSVESSLEATKEESAPESAKVAAKEPTKPTLTAVKTEPAPVQAAAEPAQMDASSKSDEELLKEFENLLNSG